MARFTWAELGRKLGMRSNDDTVEVVDDAPAVTSDATESAPSLATNATNGAPAQQANKPDEEKESLRRQLEASRARELARIKADSEAFALGVITAERDDPYARDAVAMLYADAARLDMDSPLAEDEAVKVGEKVCASRVEGLKEYFAARPAGQSTREKILVDGKALGNGHEGVDEVEQARAQGREYGERQNKGK